MKVQTETCNRPEVPHNNAVDQDTPDKKDSSRLFLHNQGCVNEPGSGSQQNVRRMVSSDSKWHSAECTRLTEGLSNGTSLENVLSHCNTNDLALRDGVPEISNELSLPEVCVAVNDEEDLSYELQQAYRIFHGFLLEKHKSITAPFLHPVGLEEHRDGGHVKRPMCLRRMEEKFVSREYETITEFVADFRLMLETSYRHHGVDHWISKQAQKLEVMLEQKLTLLSRYASFSFRLID